MIALNDLFSIKWPKKSICCGPSLLEWSCHNLGFHVKTSEKWKKNILLKCPVDCDGNDSHQSRSHMFQKVFDDLHSQRRTWECICFCVQRHFSVKKQLKTAEKRIFGDLRNYFCYCAPTLCVRVLIFLPLSKVSWLNLHFKGQPPSTFLTGGRALQRQGTKNSQKWPGKIHFWGSAKSFGTKIYG